LQCRVPIIAADPTEMQTAAECHLHTHYAHTNKHVMLHESARQLLSDLGRRISESSGDARETSFLFRRISVLVQRFNAVLLHDSLPVSDFTD